MSTSRTQAPLTPLTGTGGHSETTHSVPVLQPVLSTRYALSWQQALFVAPFVALFLYLSYLPLSPAVWNGVAAGDVILNEVSGAAGPIDAWRRIGRPTHGVPGVPLTLGAEVFRLGWLSDVVVVIAHRSTGPAGLAAISAVLFLAAAIMWAGLLRWFVAKRRWVLMALGIMLLSWWRAMDEPGSVLAGCTCLAVFCRILFHPARDGLTDQTIRRQWRSWAGIGIVMVLWCNLSASFVIGPLILTCYAIERIAVCAVELNRRGRSTLQAWTDPRVQRATLLAQFAVVVTLINPMGARLWTALLRPGANPFADAVGGYAPLQLFSLPGLILVTLALGYAVACARNTLHVGDALLLTTVAASAAINEHLLVWLAPVGTLVIARAMCDRIPVARAVEDEDRDGTERPALEFAWSLICLLLIWLGFALSPFADPVLADESRADTEWLADTTPIGATAWLNEHPVDGLVWAPAAWGDWILTAAPPETLVFAQSDFHLLPRQARTDYADIFRGEHDWLRAADRYAVAALVVNKTRQHTLVTDLRRSSDWRVRFEDHQSLVATRRSL